MRRTTAHCSDPDAPWLDPAAQVELLGSRDFRLRALAAATWEIWAAERQVPSVRSNDFRMTSTPKYALRSRKPCEKSAQQIRKWTAWIRPRMHRFFRCRRGALLRRQLFLVLSRLSLGIVGIHGSRLRTDWIWFDSPEPTLRDFEKGKLLMLSARSTARFMGTLTCGALCAPQASASNILFSLDPDASSISIAGTVTLDPGTGPVTLPFGSQDPPANTSVTTARDRSSLTSMTRFPTSLAFVGSSAVAAIGGDWLPRRAAVRLATPAPAPANYATALSLGQLGTAVAAVRELEFDIFSLPLAVAGGSFSSMQGFGIAGGVFDFNVPPASRWWRRRRQRSSVESSQRRRGRQLHCFSRSRR